MEKSQLRSGVLLSYVNLIISSIIPFIYTPVMLRMLGQAEYGLYSLSASTVSYLSLLGFGFGSTIIRYVAKYRAEENKEAEEKVFGFFLLLYCALAALVMVCGICVATHTEFIFHQGLSVNEIKKMKRLILIMTANSALTFPLSVVSAIIIAHERYVFRKLVDMISTVAAPITNIVALYLGYASVGMAVAATILQITMLPINSIYCFKNLKIYPKFSILPRSLIKEMFGFSAFIFIGSIVDMLFWSTDKVILGMLASSTVVAIYNIGSTFNTMVMNLSTSISGVLTPKITGMVVKDVGAKQLTDLFIRVGRLQFIIIALIVAGFTVFGQDFIFLWAGKEYGDAYWVAILTMFPLSIPLIQNTGLTIVVAQNKHRFRSIVYLIIAVINAISTYFIVPHMGMIGAALCSCIAYLLGQGLVMNIYYDKVTGIDIALFWSNIMRLAIIPITMLCVGLVIRRYIVFDNWNIFLLGVIVFTSIYAVTMYVFALNDYEKQIFGGLIGKIKSIKTN